MSTIRCYTQAQVGSYSFFTLKRLFLELINFTNNRQSHWGFLGICDVYCVIITCQTVSIIMLVSQNNVTVADMYLQPNYLKALCHYIRLNFFLMSSKIQLTWATEVQTRPVYRYSPRKYKRTFAEIEREQCEDVWHCLRLSS